MFSLTTGVRGVAIPEGALVCNFPDPRRSRSGPALLSHDDVVTFFHEFGHLLHHILGGDQEWVEFSGCATEWDFVEVPSQLFEEWAWDYQVLQRFAVHHETGETIPEALVERMREARDFGRGLAVRHQMFYAALSFAYHNEQPDGLDSTALMKKLQNEYSLFRFVDGTYFQACFGHLNDYSALYYTYMWSLVIAKDAFQAFKESGTLSTRSAQRYREAVLAPGGSKDGGDLIRDFLGREYSFEAFERWLDGK
jgi:thimet oligopeptidase